MALNTDMQQIYVRLLDEGTEVFRPAEAEPLPDGCFKLLPTEGYDPEDEKWEFPPGSIVRAHQQKRDGEFIWVAVGMNYDEGKNDVTV